jgi:hypothetical protein
MLGPSDAATLVLLTLHHEEKCNEHHHPWPSRVVACRNPQYLQSAPPSEASATFRSDRATARPDLRMPICLIE